MDIDISKQREKFQQFLNLPNNERIIFSGIFGSGKTYFLNRFFEKHEKYIAFHLYPTNYSISSSEDIFELIKHDLLYQILLHEPDLEKVNASFLDGLAFLGITDIAKIIEPFLKDVPKVGGFISEIWPAVIRLHELIKAKQRAVSINIGKDIQQYIKRDFENVPGNIYENDIYTQLIIKLIEHLKVTDKKVILVVDDLDRIDPEHIFRILNIFAVHFNAYGVDKSDNKFDIDKIILCCDIDNIRSIFRTKYGQDTSFSGYIDKFYTREIYHFDNREIVVSTVHQIVDSITLSQPEFKQIFWRDDLYLPVVRYILASMVMSNCINLRTLLRLKGIQYPVNSYTLRFGSRELQNWQFPLIPIYDFLAWIFGGDSQLLSAINKMHMANVKDTIVNDFNERRNKTFCEVEALIDVDAHQFRVSSAGTRRGTSVNSLKYVIEYSGGANGYYFIEPIYESSETQITVGSDMFKKRLVSSIERYIALKLERTTTT